MCKNTYSALILKGRIGFIAYYWKRGHLLNVQAIYLCICLEVCLNLKKTQKNRTTQIKSMIKYFKNILHEILNTVKHIETTETVLKTNMKGQVSWFLQMQFFKEP